nr:hypothetical protein [Nocardia alni]
MDPQCAVEVVQAGRAEVDRVRAGARGVVDGLAELDMVVEEFGA